MADVDGVQRAPPEQDKGSPDQDETTRFQQRLLKLIKQRDLLRVESAMRPLGNVLMDALTSRGARPAPSMISKEAVMKVSHMATKNAKRQKLHETHSGLRLAGVSMSTIHDDLRVLRFDTCTQGRFHEQYYVVLAPKEGGKFELYRHSLPPFVPLGALKTLLASDFAKFCMRVSEILNAFVDRREQVKALQERHRALLAEEATLSVAVDCVRFILQLPDRSLVRVYVQYEELVHTLPAAVVVQREEDGKQRRVAAAERAFMRQRLAEATQRCFGR